MSKRNFILTSIVMLMIIPLATTCLTSCQQAEIYLTIENGSGSPGSENNLVEITLDNPANTVKGIEADICDKGNYLQGVGCEAVGNASGFTCAFNELSDGCFRIILLSLSGNAIPEEAGHIINVSYNVSEEAPEGRCVAITSKSVKISDEERNPLSAGVKKGVFCFE
jgi:hypothetical protein